MGSSSHLMHGLGGLEVNSCRLVLDESTESYGVCETKRAVLSQSVCVYEDDNVVIGDVSAITPELKQ